MSDPLEDVIDDAITPTPPAETVPDGQVAISKEELERLRSAASQLEAFAPVMSQLQANPGLLDEARYRQVVETPPAPPAGSNFNWERPDESVRDIARQAMMPDAMQMNEKLARITIQSFIAVRSSDPFYHVVRPMFEKEVYGMNLAQLGSLPENSLQLVLQKAWNANVGEYSSKVAERKAKEKPPVNLGGGGSAAASEGGPKEVKHLRELNAEAYAFALQSNLTEEEMAEIAAELQ